MLTDATSHDLLRRVAFERLVDELESLDRLVSADEELDRQQLRDHVDEAYGIALALVDLDEGGPPPPS